MNELLVNLDWNEVIMTVWSVILIPVLTYVGKEINEWAQAKKVDKYVDILQKNVLTAVKDVSQTVVASVKGTDEWTEEKMAEVKEIAKRKAITALSTSAYQCLKQAIEDFDELLDSLIESSLFDIKNK